jgi:diacylglycerol kinase family enzyme
MFLFGLRPVNAPSAVSFNQRFLVHNTNAGHGELPDGVFDEFSPLDLDDLDGSPSNTASDCLVAVWGGDGTCRSVAKVAVVSCAVVLPCPGGTHNHYAKAAGFGSVEEVRQALKVPTVRLGDVGFVNDELFLNNMTIGWYVDLVARRERYQKRMPRRVAKVASVLMHMGSIRRIRVTVDGVEERVWMVWVGNGEFSTGEGDILERKSLTDGVLDVRILRAGTTFPKLKALVAVVGKRVESSKLIDRRIATTCSIGFRRSEIDVALDGELTRLRTPLEVRCDPRALHILDVT